MNTPVTRTTREIKKHNLVLVINGLKALTSATKAELAARTGLSIATCGTLLNELCLTGEVMALAQDISSGGRPAQRFACDPSFFSLLSLYVEGTSEQSRIVVSVSSALGDVVEQWDQSFEFLTLAQFTDTIGEAIARHPAIRAMGIGLPGVVAEGEVLACDIPLFEGLKLTEQLSQQFGIFVEAANDMNYSAWGFYRNSCPQEQAPLAYILQPEQHCTGCGVVINGRVLQGVSHFAGEVSFLPVPQGIEVPVIAKMVNIVRSLVAVINPATIALSGVRISPEDIAEIRRQCLVTIPQKHMPQLVYRQSIQPDYLTGIAELTLANFQRQRIFAD
jgi:hypothetical protein